jgi:hypothetical protein
VVTTGRSLYASREARRNVTLLDLLDRLLAGGVVIRGQITLAAAEIDLVELDLSILLASIDKASGR